MASELRKLKPVIVTGRLWEIEEDSDFLEKSTNQPILPTANNARQKDVLADNVQQEEEK